MHKTDDVQIRIMRQLVGPGTFRWDFRESYASMAEKLGLDEETVRRGVNRAREIGFLRDVQLVPNPSLLGYECSGITLDVADPEKKPSAISQISRAEGIIIILNLIGKSLRVTFYHRG